MKEKQGGGEEGRRREKTNSSAFFSPPFGREDPNESEFPANVFAAPLRLTSRLVAVLIVGRPGAVGLVLHIRRP